MAPLPRQLNTLVHRWSPADVVAYRIQLTASDGGAFHPLEPPVEVELPRKGPDLRDRARFTALRHGRRYRAEVTAWGDAGGTAATQRLNVTPAVAEWDFTAAQDVAAVQTASVAVVLDPVAFSGTARVSVTGAPGGTDLLRGELRDEAGLLRATVDFPPGGIARFTSLRAGERYRIGVQALSGGASLAEGSAEVWFDESLPDLEAERALTITL